MNIPFRIIIIKEYNNINHKNWTEASGKTNNIITREIMVNLWETIIINHKLTIIIGLYKVKIIFKKMNITLKIISKKKKKQNYVRTSKKMARADIITIVNLLMEKTS